MDIIKIKLMLEEIQRRFPPHYPTKTHGVIDEVDKLIEGLKTVVDYIGFYDANIAIKNIVGKMINEFLISAKQGIDKSNCDFSIENINLENCTKVIISFNEKSLELDYLNDGSITITNNSICSFNSYGEDYSNSTISYNKSNPNQILLNQLFHNKSICQSMMTFNDSGIEISKDFKIIPRTRNFQPTNQYISGSIIRSEDFYTAKVKLNVVGDNFGGLLSKEDIEKINSIQELEVPVKYMGALDTDLNLLFVVKENERDNLGSGSIGELIGNYLYSDEDKEFFEDMYKDSQQIIESSFCLEFAPSFKVSLPKIHAPYSNQILNNVKEIANLKKSNHIK